MKKPVKYFLCLNFFFIINFIQRPECDIPCIPSRDDPDISNSKKKCEHVKGFEWTMENRGIYDYYFFLKKKGNAYGNMKNIAGNTKADSDVHIQYFSWSEYAFMDPPLVSVSEKVKLFYCK